MHHGTVTLPAKASIHAGIILTMVTTTARLLQPSFMSMARIGLRSKINHTFRYWVMAPMHRVINRRLAVHLGCSGRGRGQVATRLGEVV